MKWKPLLWLGLVLWLLFPCAMYAIWCAGCELLIGTRGTPFLIQGILTCIAAACGIALAFLHYRETARAWRDRLLLALAGGFILLPAFLGTASCWFLDGLEEYHSFRSPDNAHTVVIMEQVSLISGQVALYERTSPFLICPKDRIRTDDGYRPICAGTYELAWSENAVALSVFDGAGETKTITVPLGP